MSAQKDKWISPLESDKIMYWKKLFGRLGLLLIIWLIAHPINHYYNPLFTLNDQINWLMGAIWATIMFTEEN